jgi:hypothetical protein
MAARTPDEHLTWYVINYYCRLMTETEWLANYHYLSEENAKYRNPPKKFDDMKTSDPAALSLLADGVAVFWRRVRDRILRDHADKVVLNYCPKCGGLAKTPRAQQCQWCFHDWHPREQSSTNAATGPWRAQRDA